MNIGFLASHGGSNMQAIIDACKSGKLQARPAVVISNNSDSGAIARARNEGIPCYYLERKDTSGTGGTRPGYSGHLPAPLGKRYCARRIYEKTGAKNTLVFPGTDP